MSKREWVELIFLIVFLVGIWIPALVWAWKDRKEWWM